MFSKPVFEGVSQEDFNDFITNYPVDLETTVDYAFIPSRIGYYDKDLEIPNVRLVAYTYDYTDTNIQERYKEYYILSNVDDLYIELEEEFDNFYEQRDRLPKRLSEQVEEENKKILEQISRGEENDE